MAEREDKVREKCAEERWWIYWIIILSMEL